MPTDLLQSKALALIDRWSMLPDGCSVGVAVSGGADSVALFRTIHALRAQRGWRIVVLHVNHKLRGQESDEDARFVQLLSNEYDTAFMAADLPLTQVSNLEEQARVVRCAWLKQCTILHNLHKVALGHTLSDQAETVLFRFLRGSGSAGLAGIHPVTPDGFVRPLLCIGRDEIRAQLCTIGQPWREDSSNQSLQFDRNRIRHQLLPALARDWNPAIETTLAQTADWALAEEDFWADTVGTAASLCLSVQSGPVVIADVDRLQQLPLALERRLLRHAIRLVRGDLRAVTFAHVEQIRALVAQPEGSGRLQLPGVDVLRSFDRIRFAPPQSYSGERHWSVAPRFGEEISIPDSNFRLMLRLGRADNLYNETGNSFDLSRIAGSLLLRTWQPGDEFRPVGRSNSVKLKTLFQENRIPLWERRTWPVLVDEATQSLVWTRRFGVAADFAANSPREIAVIIDERQEAERQESSSFPKPESGTGRPTSIEIEDPTFGLPHEAETE